MMSHAHAGSFRLSWRSFLSIESAMLLVESLKALKPGAKMLTVSFQQLDTDFLNNQCSAISQKAARWSFRQRFTNFSSV